MCCFKFLKDQYKAFYKHNKMEWENIILTGACFAVIVAAAYYFWKKSSAQTQQIAEMNKRIEAIELAFAPQPSHATLDRFFPVSSQPNIPQTHIYTYVPQHREHANDQKIIDLNEVQTKNTYSAEGGGRSTASISSQVDEHELTPLVIKPTRPVDIEKITDNLLPVISSADGGGRFTASGSKQ
jgi:hypothetical protein